MKVTWFSVVLILMTASAFAEGEAAREEAREDALIHTQQLAFERNKFITGHLTAGQRLLGEGKIKEAISHFEKVLEVDERQETACSLLKQAQEGLKERSRLEIKRSEEEKARNVRDGIKEGRGCFKEGRFENALEKFRAVLTLEPQNKTALMWLERITEKIEEEAAREEELDLSNKAKEEELAGEAQEKKRKRSLEEHLRAGTDCFNNGDYGEAIRQWQKAYVLARPGDAGRKTIERNIASARLAEDRRLQRKTDTEVKREEREAVLGIQEEWSKTGRAARIGKPLEKPEEAAPVASEIAKKVSVAISIKFKETPLRDVITYLAGIGGITIFLDEAVYAEAETEAAEGAEEEEPKEKFLVTTDLRDIPLIEALDIILRMQGLVYRIEGNIIRVTTPENLEKGDLEIKKWKPYGGIGNLEEILRKAVPLEGGDVPGIAGSRLSVFRASGTIVMRNTVYNLGIADEIIKSLQVTPPQVDIRTRFAEVVITDISQFGVDWDMVKPLEQGDTRISGRGGSGGPSVDLGVSGSGEGLSMQFARLSPTQFNLVLRAFESNEKVNMLAAPRITAHNNEEALIEVYQSCPYVTSYTFKEDTVECGGDDYKRTVVYPEDSESRKVGVMLRVTPAIDLDKRIISLSLQPEVIEHGADDYDEYGSGDHFSIMRMPFFKKRTLTTYVDINDGDTLVLGGLITEVESESTKEIPFISRIPLLGNLFRSRGKTTEKKNLIIFVTPRIITPTGQPLGGE